MKRKPTLWHILGTSGVALCLLWGVAARVFQSPPLADSPGTISGRVTRDGGLPAAGFTVSASWAARPFLRYNKDNPNITVTDADGRYTLRLRPYLPMFLDGPVLNIKGYSVQVSNGGQPYVEPPPQIADPDARPDHTVSDVNFVLRLGPQISVYIRDAITGASDAGLTVRYGPEFVGANQTAGVTGPDGRLQFRIPLTKAEIRVDLPDALTQAPGYGIGSGFYKRLEAAPGQEVVWNLRTYSARTNTDANWHGLVLTPDGRPAAGAVVTLLRLYNTGFNLLTDATGHFSIRLPRFASQEAPEWNGTPPMVFARQGTLAITHIVTPDESWDGITLRLAPGASLVGRLTDVHGQPAAGVGVSVGETFFARYGQGSPLPPQTSTDAQGHFTFSGLPPGGYHVMAGGSGFGNAVLPPSRHGVWDTLSAMTLTAGQHHNMGAWAIPRADQTLTGTVTDAQGRPYTQLSVFATGAHTQQGGVVQKNGTFSIPDVVAEPLQVTLMGEGTLPATDVAPGQKTVHLIITPEAVAANVPAPPRSPNPAPRGPVSAYPSGAALPINRLGLVVRPTSNGQFTAAVVRPNDLNEWQDAILNMTMNFSPNSMPLLWQGTLDDVEGMRLTVRHYHGTLADRRGRVLWAGLVQDPPDYIVTLDNRHDASITTLCDRQGKILWSGKTAPWVNEQPVRNGVLRLYRAGQTVVWQKAVWNARVAVRDIYSWSTRSPVAVDGVVVLHLEKVTGTLRGSDGRVLWTGPDTMVEAQAVGSVALQMPHFPPTLYTLRNAPPKSTLSFTQADGQPIEGTMTFG